MIYVITLARIQFFVAVMNILYTAFTLSQLSAGQSCEVQWPITYIQEMEVSTGVVIGKKI